jgi:hypothetical protein
MTDKTKAPTIPIPETITTGRIAIAPQTVLNQKIMVKETMETTMVKITSST